MFVEQVRPMAAKYMCDKLEALPCEPHSPPEPTARRAHPSPCWPLLIVEVKSLKDRERLQEARDCGVDLQT